MVLAREKTNKPISQLNLSEIHCLLVCGISPLYQSPQYPTAGVQLQICAYNCKCVFCIDNIWQLQSAHFIVANMGVQL